MPIAHCFRRRQRWTRHPHVIDRQPTADICWYGRIVEAANADAPGRAVALDSFASPAGVLPRHLLDKRRQLGTNGRASSLGREGPAPADQPAGQRSSVSSVTSRPLRKGLGSTRASAASTARSAQSISAWGTGAAGPRPHDAAPAARRPWTLTSEPAAPATLLGARTPDTAAVPPQGRDRANPAVNTAGILADRLPTPPFGTPASKDARPRLHLTIGFAIVEVWVIGTSTSPARSLPG